MALGWIGKARLKMNEWFSEPLGAPPVPDNTGTVLKKPEESFEASKPQTNRKTSRGRGDAREIPKNIAEFHPRGSAGHRQARGPRSAKKVVMPHKGSRPRYPK
jgi:hypothetical protein